MINASALEKESFLLSYVLKEKELPNFIEKITNKDTGEVRALSNAAKSTNRLAKGLSIYDLPGYFQLENGNSQLMNFSSPLYYGYKINLFQYRDFEDYLQLKVRKARYSQLRRYRKRLDKCLNPSFKIFYGAIEKQHYDLLFERLREMMERRFREKEEYNFELPYLDFYKAVMYPLICNKRAALFAIYSNSKPICITLNFIFKNTVYHWNSAYDIDYAMFNLGHINTFNHLEWCFSQGFTGFDMGRGDFFHKRKWIDTRYQYRQEIYIPRSHPWLFVQAFSNSKFISLRFWIINNLKKLKIHLAISKINKMLYRAKNAGESDTRSFKVKILEEGNLFKANEAYFKSGPEALEGSRVLKHLNYFLHQNQEAIDQLTVLRKKGDEDILVFQGIKKYRIIQLFS